MVLIEISSINTIYYTTKKLSQINDKNHQFATAPIVLKMVVGEGFEPSKAEPSDLQSDPFDRSGTQPSYKL